MGAEEESLLIGQNIAENIGYFGKEGGASGWSVGVPAKAATLKPIHSLDPSGNEREAAAEESVSLRKASSRWSQVPETERESQTMIYSKQ